MNLHEYQAKALFKAYGMPVPNYIVVTTPHDARLAAEKLGAGQVVVKAQVHAGGRVKAAGIKMVDTPREAEDYAKMLLGMQLVTAQTSPAGLPVNTLLLEEKCEVAEQLYLSVLVDQSVQQIVVLASTEGGVDVEHIARDAPHKVLKSHICSSSGIVPSQSKELASGLGLNAGQVIQFSTLLSGLCQLFIEKDLTLAEINPLVITRSGEFVCLDGKLIIDENALYRQPEMLSLRDSSQQDDRELLAAKHDLSYVALNGNIGCLSNGSGLALSSMDVIQHAGGCAANFLDVGADATSTRVSEAFNIILSDQQVKGILVNIFGGIVRCDKIAEGVIAAFENRAIDMPVVLRLQGLMAEEGRALLEQSGLNIQLVSDLDEAAQKIVAMVDALS